MNEEAFENARTVCDALDEGKPWDLCKELVIDDGFFSCQAEALSSIHSIKEYSEWMNKICNDPFEGNIHFDSHFERFDPSNNSALFFRTYHGKHTGSGGPIEPPTEKNMDTDYVCWCKMDGDGKVMSIQKVWNDVYAMKQAGWM